LRVGYYGHGHAIGGASVCRYQKMTKRADWL